MIWGIFTLAKLKLTSTFYCLEMLRLILFRTRDYLLWNGLLIILGQLWTSLIMQPPYSPQFQHIFYTTTNPFFLRMSFNFIFHAKLYTPSTLNIDLILWHTQFIKCAENVKSWVFPLTFQAYILPHTKVIYTKYSKQFKWNSYFYVSGQNRPFWAVLKLI